SGWTRLVHPEGALYFQHKDGIYTDADIRDPEMFEKINCAIKSIKNAGPPIQTGSCVHLVIEVLPPKDQLDETRRGGASHRHRSTMSINTKDEDDSEANAKHAYGYYFVNHDKRCLLWPKEFKYVSKLFFNVRGVKSWDHVHVVPYGDTVKGHVMEMQYWYVFNPTSDSFTPATSLSPFDKEELSRILDLSSHIRGEDYRSCSNDEPHIADVLARARSFNFHGEVGARLDADQTVYNIMERRHSILHYLITWILFLAPNVHMKALKTIWVDQNVNYVPWKQFLEKLNNEWQELVLYATVILNANVAFLSIPMVNGSGNNSPPPETSAEICSYISVATSLGAVATGLLLMRQNRTKRRETAEDAANFMMKMDCSTFGMETIAILFSLPYGMLMWSLLSFVCGFCILMFQATDVTTRVLVGFVGVLVTIFTCWTISYA
ncbi:hypothetical protein BU15DRAFT_19368, partial [Melanogaster broomeanus]